MRQNLLVVALFSLLSGCGRDKQADVPQADFQKQQDAAPAPVSESPALSDDLEKRWQAIDRERDQREAERLAKEARDREQLARQKEQERLRLIAAREDDPQLTAQVYQIEENPAAFIGKCIFLDDVWVSGDVDKDEDRYTVTVKDSRGETHSGFSGVVFSCSQPIANSIRESTQANVLFRAKIYCQVIAQEKRPGTTIYIDGKEVIDLPPIAEIYKIQVYNAGGGVHSRITEGGIEKVSAANSEPRSPMPLSQASGGDSVGVEKEIAGWQAEIKTAEDRAKKLNSELRSMRSELADLRSRIGRVRRSGASTARARKALEDMESSAILLEDKISAQEGEIESVTSRIRYCNEQIEGLKKGKSK